MAEIKIYTLTDTYSIRNDSIMDNIVLDKYVTETERLTLGSVIASQLSFNCIDKSIPWDNVLGIEYFNNGQIIFKGYIEEHELEGDIRHIVALDVLSAFDIVVTQEMYNEIFYYRYVSIDEIIRKCIEIANRYTVKFGAPYSTINQLSYQQLNVPLNTPDFSEFETATLRNILQWVCEIIGAVVYTKGINIVLKSIGNKYVSIKHSEMYSYSHSEKPISVTGIEYTAGEISGNEIEEKEYFIGTEDKVVSLSNNPFLAYNGNHGIIQALLDDLKKYKYYPGVIRLAENSFLRDDIDFLDNIAIYDEENVARLFLVTHIRFSEGSFYELESIGRNWKSAEKNVEGKLNTRKRMRERKSIRQIHKVATELANVAEEARNNYKTEKSERIKEAKRIEDLALNSPVTETRIEPNSIKTSHLKANAVRANAILVDQALINKLTTNKILSEVIWADFIYTRKQAVDLLQAGTIVDKTGNNYWNLTTGEIKLSGNNVLIPDIKEEISELSKDIEGLTLIMQTRGKYRNTLIGSDNFENYSLDTSYYYATREDGSIIFGFPSSSNSSETYFLFPLDRLEYSNKGDRATLLVDRLFANASINKIVFSLADKDKNVVSNAFNYGDNSKLYEFTLTGKPEYLRVVVGRTNTNDSVGVRFYKETIAVVAGSIDTLTWDMTYINDSVTQYKFLKDEFTLSLGQLKTEIKGDINGLTLSGSKITLTGATKVNGSFKIGANNISEIGGFKITNTVLEGGKGSNYIRLSGNSGYTSILVGGNDWNSAKFAVSSTGSMKAVNGTIAGFTISNGTLEAGSGSSYVRMASTSGAMPFMAGGETWNSAKFVVSSTGYLKATGANIGDSSFSGTASGTGRFSSGSYTGSGYLYSGSTLAGYSLSDSDGYLTLSSVYVSNRFSTRNFVLGNGKIEGVYHSGAGGYMYASLGRTGWSITNSDIRLKENVKTMGDDTVKEIYNLPLIEYTYKSDENKVLNYGVNANLLSKILPKEFAKSFIFQDKESGFYGAKYEMLTPHLVKAVQDLNKRLERLENE